MDERFTVTEDLNFGELQQDEFVASQCQEAGFDDGFRLSFGTDLIPMVFCVDFEGYCSGIISNGELKECTVTNYVVIAVPS